MKIKNIMEFTGILVTSFVFSLIIFFIGYKEGMDKQEEILTKVNCETSFELKPLIHLKSNCIKYYR